MSDSLDAPAPGALPPPALSLTTPTGLQSIDELTRRRRLVLGLNLITYALMLGWASRILAAGGWTWIDAVLFLAFALGTPWAVLGFWNALIGLWLLNAGGTDARMDRARPQRCSRRNGRAPLEAVSRRNTTGEMMHLSYAQNMEDYHLELIFAGEDDGTYVDVGAGHPVADNVSFHFYLKGWRGLVVEPQEALARLYAHVRPRDHAAIGAIIVLFVVGLIKRA